MESFLLPNREQRDRGVIFADKDRVSAPNIIVLSFEAEDIDVPLSRTFYIAYRQSDMVNTFEVHTNWS